MENGHNTFVIIRSYIKYHYSITEYICMYMFIHTQEMRTGFISFELFCFFTALTVSIFIITLYTFY